MNTFSTPLDVLGRRDIDPARRPPRSEPRKAVAGALDDAQARSLADAAGWSADTLLDRQATSLGGLPRGVVEQRRHGVGANVVDHDKPAPAVVQLLRAFVNPFILILIFLAVVMIFTDVVFADPADGPDFTGVITVSVMVLVSAMLRFWQDYRSGRAAEDLKAMVRTTVAVTREYHGTPVTAELPIEDLVPGDIVRLAAGDMIPADVRLIAVNALQVNQSMLTGEALAAAKTAAPATGVTPTTILDAPNLAFMGTSVVSGTATAVVLGTGRNSYFGSMSSAIVRERPETAFDAGIKKVSYTLIRFMAVMVPVVFVVNGLTKDWTSAFLFGVTTAVGLTPEMLPLIVTANLAKGARFMARRKVIVKSLPSIQNLGAMDILATDKTGTLTEDRIVLERHLDVDGVDSEVALRYGAMNAHFQTGLRNLLDDAVLEAAGLHLVAAIGEECTRVDEIPFDFTRRRMSVVVDDGHSRLIVTKGAVEEVVGRCVSELRDDVEQQLTEERRAQLDELVAAQNARGMRVLAVAIRTMRDERDEYSENHERDLTLVGFLLFLDPPKASASAAIASLRGHGVAITVISGDTPLVVAKVCRDVGIDVDRVVTGTEIDGLSLRELAELAEQAVVFAKVDPTQKARIVEALRTHGHTVGFLGDGINDAPALRTADVGISVDTAVDIAKESADVILLEKDLTVLEAGVVEGRRTFVNTMKYIKMTASSNFGNMFSVLVASAMLPFIPMIPLVVLVQNLAYDLSMLTLPWDRVDEEDLAGPRAWESRGLGAFMVRIGPLSSIFDITTYALMWFVFAANSPAHAALFQSGWFVESIISQTLIAHLLRTGRMPFVQSRASLPVLAATAAVCVFGLVLPFTEFGHGLGLVSLPWSYFPWLASTLVAYCVVVQAAKQVFVRRYGAWI